MADRSRDVSDELTEIRTVLSRAETALARLELNERHRGATRIRWVNGEMEYYAYEPDPDIKAMITRLEQVVWCLHGWRKAGATASTRHRRWITGAS